MDSNGGDRPVVRKAVSAAELPGILATSLRQIQSAGGGNSKGVRLSLHNKSCLLDAMCHALGIAPWRAIVWIGHDGSECGFHSQEVIDVAFIEGYAVTEIQRRPVGIRPDNGELVPIKTTEAGDARFADYLGSCYGVVMGSWMGRPHAVSWVDQVATDISSGLSFRLLDDRGKLLEEFFVPHTFLRVTKYG